jgi:hypothetical protein
MPDFSKTSLLRLRQAHPELRRLMVMAIREFNFIIADSQRGRIAQERAFATGHSKVRFGQSAHNWTPSLALDLWPAPFDPETPIEMFYKLQIEVIKPIAAQLGIPIRQGIDFNMDGNLSNDKWDDLPHIELHPWRDYAKRAELFEG